MYWSNLAKDGSPNSQLDAGAVPWPPYTVASDQHLFLDVPATPGSGLNSDLCAFWSDIYPSYYFQP